MKKNDFIILALTTFFLLALPFIANADILTFEDLYPGYETTGAVPSNYSGFTWDANTYWITKDYLPGSGYDYGTVGHVSIFNYNRNNISMGLNTGYFNFTGAYITSAWNYSQNVIIEGWKDGALQYTNTITTSYDKPYWFDFNYNDIDTVWFKMGTGSTDSTWVAIDNITTTVAPEPISFILFITGGTLLSGRRLLKRERS